MCFYKYAETVEEAKAFIKNVNVAKEDIPVYKLVYDNGNGVDGEYRSGVKDFIYQRGKTYSSKTKFWQKKFGVRRDEIIIQIDRGLHSYTTKELAASYQEYSQIMVKMIVPRGASYYINGDVMVSNKIYFPTI